MLVHLIILSAITVSQNYAAVKVKQESHIRRERDENQAVNYYPFLAYVNIGDNSCAGAIISESWVLTARACGNTTTQEPGWVFAGSNATSIQKRRIAQQHSCPDDHRLLLLNLEEPFEPVDDCLMWTLPIVQPGTFGCHEDTCWVITFGAEPSETSLDTAHGIKTRLDAGSECMGSASDGSAVVPRNSGGAPSTDSAHNGTTDKAAITAATNETHSSAESNPAKASGDAGKKTERDIPGLEEMEDTNLLCSSEENEGAAKYIGSPVICNCALVALVTPNPFHEASREKKEDPKTYYTAIGPDYNWIMEKVPEVEVVSSDEITKEERSVRSKTANSFPEESCLRKYKKHLKNRRRRRLSRLANMLAAVAPGKDSSGASKLELEDEVEPQLRMNKIFSVWFPLARRVRGIILLNRMLLRPENELWGDLSEKAEAALRPLRRVKRSNPEQDPEGPTGDAKAAPPLLRPWSFRRAKREDSGKHQQRLCDEASDGQRKRSAGGDIAEHVPCVTESRAHHGTTRLAQRLAVRDKTSRAPRWRDRQPVNTA